MNTGWENRRETSFTDKSLWLRGVWDSEPDKVHWVDEVSGFDCLMRRGFGGVWCGYVGVPEGHPAFEKGYNDVEVCVHGGLTFASFCQEENKEHGICHVPLPGRPDRVWWLGFDTNHGDDYPPEYAHRYQFQSAEAYKTLTYVRAQTECLAAQLAGKEYQ